MLHVVDEFEFKPRHAALWGTHTLKLRHSLASQDLFSDEQLASLIEEVDPAYMAVNTMADKDHDASTWHYCDRGGLSGMRVLEAVRRGRIWINISKIQDVDGRYAEILDSMFHDLEQRVPGFRTIKRQLGLLISSPNAQVFYHADVPGQALWQIRGRKQIWIYPSRAPFINAVDLENIVRQVTEEEISYETWFDTYAETHVLEPGDMLHWPLNGPHRVTNLDSMNVSLTTEHWTTEIRRSYAMNFGNGLLRSKIGWTPRSHALSGAAFWSKVALTAAWRKAGMQKRQAFQRVIDYRVDPEAVNGVRPLRDSTTPQPEGALSGRGNMHVGLHDEGA